MSATAFALRTARRLIANRLFRKPTDSSDPEWMQAVRDHILKNPSTSPYRPSPTSIIQTKEDTRNLSKVLIAAALHGDIDMIGLCVHSLNHMDSPLRFLYNMQNNTPEYPGFLLYCTILLNNLDACQWLLTRYKGHFDKVGFNFQENPVSDPSSLLSEAIHAKQWEIAKALIEAGADINNVEGSPYCPFSAHQVATSVSSTIYDSGERLKAKEFLEFLKAQRAARITVPPVITPPMPDEWATSLKHAESALKEAPIEVKKEISKCCEYIKGQLHSHLANN